MCLVLMLELVPVTFMLLHARVPSRRKQSILKPGGAAILDDDSVLSQAHQGWQFVGIVNLQASRRLRMRPDHAVVQSARSYKKMEHDRPQQSHGVEKKNITRSKQGPCLKIACFGVLHIWCLAGILARIIVRSSSNRLWMGTTTSF